PKNTRDSEAGKLIARDDFAKEAPDVWEQVSGEWKYDGGRLIQNKDGAERGVLRLKAAPPIDFQVRVRFTILAGQQWKSVGVAFDSDANNELLAYVSAYAGGPKAQLAYKQGADYAYPTDGAAPWDVRLDQPQELLVQARGTLVNVSVNGKLALAWRS